MDITEITWLGIWKTDIDIVDITDIVDRF